MRLASHTARQVSKLDSVPLRPALPLEQFALVSLSLDLMFKYFWLGEGGWLRVRNSPPLRVLKDYLYLFNFER